MGSSRGHGATAKKDKIRETPPADNSSRRRLKTRTALETVGTVVYQARLTSIAVSFPNHYTIHPVPVAATMRLLGRSNAQETPTTKTSDVVLQLGDADLPVKAERLLGTSSPFARRRKKKENRDSFQHVHSEEQKNLGRLLATQEALLDTMPDNGGLRPWPTINSQQSRSVNDLLQPSMSRKATKSSTTNGQNGQVRKEGSDSTLRSYYDARRLPTAVSQQTSASAVRDMALRKGSPMIHDISSEPNFNAQQLLPQSSPRSDTRRRRPSNPSSSKRRPKLDLASLFPQPKSSSRPMLSPSKLMHSPSAITNVSEFFPPDTVHLQLRRPSANARFESAKSVPLNTQPGRAKVFEKDVYDSAKVNVRRPPKGIQNWFDGFDISSDESEPDPEQKVLSAEAFSAAHVFNPALGPSRARVAPTPRLAAKDPVMENLQAIDVAKEQLKLAQLRLLERRGSEHTTAVDSAVSSPPQDDSKQESRIATSRLQDHSVLSLSSSSEDDQDDLLHIRDSLALPSDVSESELMLGSASSMGMERLSAVPKKLQTNRSIGRDSHSTVQTSGSIPIINGDDLLPMTSPALPRESSIPREKTELRRPPIPKRITSTSYSNPNPDIPKLKDAFGEDMNAPTRKAYTDRASTAPSAQEEHDSVANETSNTFPSDASRMMVVTDEEMALLEMMRRKRAAMQKNSFTEGYKLALKTEQEQLKKRRLSAQQTALGLLKEKEERNKSRRASRLDGLEEENDDKPRKLSALKKEEVDKALKIERFLAMEMPIEAAFPSPPTSGHPSRMPMEDDVSPKQTLETLPQTRYFKSHSAGKAGFNTKSNGNQNESVATPDQELSNMLDQFREMSSSTDVDGAFPTPPSARKTERRANRRWSRLSPVTQEDIPAIPERSPSRPRLETMRAEPSYRSEREARTSSYASGSEPLLDTAESLEQRSAYHLSPNLDFQPLDFSPHIMSTPSLSTSRASPLTPTFPLPSGADHVGVKVLGSDNASLRSRAYTPDTDLSLRAAEYSDAAPTGASSSRRIGKRKPAPLESLKTEAPQRVGSITSITSAGEDVLAAWNALGGGRDAYKARTRMRGA